VLCLTKYNAFTCYFTIVAQIRTNNVTLAVHILQGAHQLCPDDPITLNELGVAALALDDLGEALQYFKSAVRMVSQFQGNYKYIDSEEILCNYGTCLRRSNRLDEALVVYQRCLAMNPRSTENHANVGFTLHLMRRFGEAIECYHTVLGFEPAHAFCAEMLNNAIEDSLSLAGPRDRGPVGLLFGGGEEGGVQGSEGVEDMVLSPLDGAKMFSGQSFIAAELTDEKSGVCGSAGGDSARPHVLFPDNSALMESMQSESGGRGGFLAGAGMASQGGGDNSGAMTGKGSVSGADFHLHNAGSIQPETPFSGSTGSVCPFPGFGMPSTGAASRVRPDSTPTGSNRRPHSGGGIVESPIGRAGPGETGAAEYSPYSYMLAVGGTRRVSLNANKSVAFSDALPQDSQAGESSSSSLLAGLAAAGQGSPDGALDSSDHSHIRGADLSGIYSEQTEESRTEFEMCGALDDQSSSFQSGSPSVLSFSRVTGNLSWSADMDASRDGSER
jgi:hypothetical protein